MKRQHYIALGVCLVAAAAVALPITLGPIDTGRVEFTNCPGDAGESGKTVAAGTYLMRVLDETVSICWPGQCDAGTGGEKFPAGVVMLTSFGASVILTCKSTNGTGDLVFTQAQ